MRKTLIHLTFFSVMLISAACIPISPKNPTAAAPFATEPTAVLFPTVTPTQPTPTPEVTASPTPYSGLITSNNASGLNVLKSLELPVDPSAIIWSIDGKTIAVTAYKDVVLVDVANISIIKHVTLPETEVLLDFSSDGHSMASSATDFKTIKITNILTGEVTQTIDPGVQFVNASFSHDGSLLVVGSADQWAGLLFDIVTGKLVDTITGFQTAAPVYTVRFGYDNSRLVWIARGSIQVETIAQQTLGADIGHEDFITAWSLSHSDALLATSAAGTLSGVFSPLLHFWNPTTGIELGKLLLPDSAVSLDFSPDDTLLAVTAGENLVVWDVKSQVQIFIDPAHLGGARDARFSPDGSILASIGADSILNLWTTY
jgi:WD40 repeat protein